MNNKDAVRPTKGQKKAAAVRAARAAAQVNAAKAETNFDEVFVSGMVRNAVSLWTRHFGADNLPMLESIVLLILQADQTHPLERVKGGAYEFVKLDEHGIPDAPAVAAALEPEWGTVWTEEPIFLGIVISALEASRRKRLANLAAITGFVPWELRKTPVFDDFCVAVWRVAELRSVYRGMQYLDTGGRILTPQFAKNVLAAICHHPQARLPIDLDRAYQLPADIAATALLEVLGDEASFFPAELLPSLAILGCLGKEREQAARAQMVGFATLVYIHARLLAAGLCVEPRIIPEEESASGAVGHFRAIGMKGTPIVRRNYVITGDHEIPLWEYLEVTR